MARVKELAGTLNQRVTIKSRSTSQDAAGQPVDTWSNVVADIAASILHGTGAETIRAGETASMTRASIRIRWRTGVTPAMRVYHGSDVYEIRQVLPDYATRAHVDLVCETVNADL